MMPYTLVLVFALVLGPLGLNGQNADHPVERATKSCLERAGTPAAMSECTKIATALWEQEVERNAEELSALLDDESRRNLKASQTEWLRFKEAEKKSIAGIYALVPGAASAVMAAEDQMELARSRASDLRKFIDLAKASKH